MKLFVLSLALIAGMGLTSVQVQAQTTSNSNSNSQSGSQSVIQFEGGQSFRNTPSVSAPGIIHTSPCVVSQSGGVSFSGFGISGGSGKIDENCVLLQQAAALQAVGGNKLAMNHLCKETSMRETMRVTGYNCPNRSVTHSKTKHDIYYDKCYKNEETGNIHVRPKSKGVLDAAISQCKKSLQNR